ncbi:hypothetical protein Tco_0030742 [Tanacetum coccineum]
MHTSKDDYLINTLRFVSAREETQIYEAILPESLTSPEMKETKAYQIYLGFATGATPPKKALKFKKPTSPKLTTVPVSTEEPTGKSKRVKRPAKKSTQALARGVVIRETPEMPVSKKKEKVDVTRDFHKSHPSSSGTATKPTPSAAIIKPYVINEGTGVKPGVPDVTKEESSKSEVKSWRNDEDDSNNEHESSGEDSDQENASDNDKTQSNDENESDFEHETDENESDETKITDKAEGDEDEEMDYTTSQLYNDVDIWLNEPIDSDKGFVQEEGTDAAMTNIQQGNENLEILQVIEDAHVTLSTIPQKTETDAEIVSPMDVHVDHEVPNQQTPTLLTLPISVIYDSSPVFPTVIPQSLPSFTSPP